MAFFIDAIGETPLIIDEVQGEVQGEQGIIFDFVLTDDFSGLSAVCMCVCVLGVCRSGREISISELFGVCARREEEEEEQLGAG
jgi:hypothetical protein